MFRPFLAVLLLALTASAQIIGPQSVSFTGRLEVIPAPPPFGAPCLAPQYQVACSDGTVFVASTSLDLAPHVGFNRTFVATQTQGCPTLSVSEVNNAVATLTICGTPGLGCPIRIHSQPGGVSSHALFLALSPGFVPISPSKGTFLLGEPSLLVAIATGAFPSEGATFDFNLPQDVALIGVPLYWQAASRDVGPVGPLRLSNVDCITAIGFTIVCIDPSTCF